MPSSFSKVLRTTLANRPPLTLIFIYLLIAFGVGLRLVFLNADPSYPEWIGYITDEGRWSGVARDIALFGQHELTGLSTLHIAFAPLYQFLVWVSFEAFGVDFWSARLFSAICGSILLILAARFLWRIGVTTTALLLGVVILALQPDLVFLSRVAIPEMTATLVHFFAFLVLLRDKPTIRSTIIAGLITVAGVAMKATTMPLVFVFAAIAAYCATAGRKQQIQHALGFTLGVAVPGILFLGVIIWSRGMQALIDVITIVAQFADISSMYGIVGFLFENRYLQPVNLLLLAAWCVGTLVKLKGVKYQSHLGRVYIASAIWVAGWITVASLMNYFPQRYFFMVLIPLAIHLSAGLTLLAIEPADEPPTPSNVTKSWVAAAAVSLPIAIIITPLLVGLVGELVPDAHRMRGRLAIIFISMAMLSVMGRQIPVAYRTLAAATFFPVLAAIGWFIAATFDALPYLFWDSTERQYIPTWITIYIMAGSVSIATTFRLSKLHKVGPVIGGTLTAATALIFLTQLIPGYFDRHYTIRNASIDIGRVLQDAPNVLSVSAESMFLANRISFTTGPSSKTPSHFVVAFDNNSSEQLIGYSKLRSYALYRHRDYSIFHSKFDANPALAKPTIKVYQESTAR